MHMVRRNLTFPELLGNDSPFRQYITGENCCEMCMPRSLDDILCLYRSLFAPFTWVKYVVWCTSGGNFVELGSPTPEAGNRARTSNALGADVLPWYSVGNVLRKKKVHELNQIFNENAEGIVRMVQEAAKHARLHDATVLIYWGSLTTWKWIGKCLSALGINETWKTKFLQSYRSTFLITTKHNRVRGTDTPSVMDLLYLFQRMGDWRQQSWCLRCVEQPLNARVWDSG